MIDPNTGRRFSSAYQPSKRGRKRSALKKFIKDNEVSLQDIRLCFQNLICRDLAEIRRLKAEAETLPALIGFVCSALLRDYKAGKLDTLNALLDRVWGKPQALLEVSEKRGDIPSDPEERRALIDQIEKELELTVDTSA